MLEAIILGLIQGVTEWLPVSSEGVILLIKTHLFSSSSDLETTIKEILFLHLGTFLAALFYFRKDVGQLFNNKQILKFLIMTTLISGLLGIILLELIPNFANARVITLIIGFCLLVTAFFQIKAPSGGYKRPVNLNKLDGLILGLLQGLAILPGLSRSGLTVGGLLLRKFDDFYALKLSFLMSLPIVLAGNLILNWEYFNFSWENGLALIASFGAGLLTIKLLLKLAQKINFGYFVFGFALLTIASVFI